MYGMVCTASMRVGAGPTMARWSRGARGTTTVGAKWRECGLVEYLPGTYVRPRPMRGDARTRARPSIIEPCPTTSRLVTTNSPGHAPAETAPASPIFDAHGPREECGVVGIHAPGHPVAR